MQVTTADRWSPGVQQRAEGIAVLPGFRLVRRRDVDWSEAVLVVGRERLAVREAGRTLAWHPGLLHARREAGVRHPLVRAAALFPGCRVLDATLGLGVDAIVFADLTRAPVVGVERVPALALLAAEGLRAHPVHVVCTEAVSFLLSIPAGSFDVVFVDPMFPRGREHNPNLPLARALGSYTPLPAGWLHEARRVARHRVVMRDAPDGPLLDQLVGAEILPSRVGRPRYAWWPGLG